MEAKASNVKAMNANKGKGKGKANGNADVEGASVERKATDVEVSNVTKIEGARPASFETDEDEGDEDEHEASAKGGKTRPKYVAFRGILASFRNVSKEMTEDFILDADTFRARVEDGTYVKGIASRLSLLANTRDTHASPLSDEGIAIMFPTSSRRSTPLTDDEKWKALAMFVDGESIKKIAESVGTHQGAVRRLVRESDDAKVVARVRKMDDAKTSNATKVLAGLDEATRAKILAELTKGKK